MLHKDIMCTVLKFLAKQICILVTLCGVVTVLILFIVLLSGQHLDYLPHICGFVALACFIIFGTVQCCLSCSPDAKEQEQEQQPQALAPAESAIAGRHRTELSPELAASESADEIYPSHSHQGLRATPSLPTYEDAITHQGLANIAEPPMTLPTYEEAEMLASDGMKSSVQNSQQ